MLSKWFEAEEFIKTHDILTITETKLNPSTSDQVINPHDFFISRADRTCHGGGVLTYINPTLKPTSLLNVQERFNKLGLEITISKVIINHDNFAVLGVYRPPNVKAAWFDAFRDLILELSPNFKLIVMGDLNCNLLTTDLAPTNKLLLLLELANVVIQTQDIQPTRITSTSSTCLDFIAVDRSVSITKYFVSDFFVSDHLPVAMCIAAVTSKALVPVVKRSFREVNYLEFGSKLDSIHIESATCASQLDKEIESWNSQVISLLDIYAPYRQFPRVNKVSWINQGTRSLVRYRDALTRKVKKLGSQDLVAPYLDLVKSCNRMIKSRTRATLKRKASSAMASQQPKETWKFINKATFRRPRCSNTANLPNISSVNDFFGELVHGKECPLAPLDVDNSNLSVVSSPDKFSLTPIDIYSTANLLRNIKPDSSMGPDSIPAYFLKTWAPFLACNITILFNSSLAIGAFPTAWKKANVVAIYKKKGLKTAAENYRPISILPILARLLERAVATQLQLYCDTNIIIPIQQFGFRKNSSCELALLAALDTWLHDVSLGKLVGALLLDLSKAFDSVPHQLLCKDLEHIGCDSNSLNWFYSYLSSRVQRVVYGRLTSPWKPVSKGVPQGSSLSPLLFNIFVRELPQACDGAVFQFADDLTNSVTASDPIVLSSNLQAAFTKVKSFCDTRELAINLSKTQLIIFKSSHKLLPTDFAVDIGGTSLSPAPHVHILGVTIDQHFTMATHIQLVSKKCHGLLGVLRRAASYLTPSLLKLVYTSLIRSSLEYNSALFAMSAPSHLKKLDIIQKISSRIITNSPPTTHSAPLQSLLGLDSLELRRLNHVAKLVEKIISGNSHPFFLNFFPIHIPSADALPTRCNKNLDNKRFSRFGLRVVNEKAKSGCTNIRALEPISVGRSLINDISHTPSQVIALASSSTELLTADVAPFGHRG